MDQLERDGEVMSLMKQKTEESKCDAGDEWLGERAAMEERCDQALREVQVLEGALELKQEALAVSMDEQKEPVEADALRLAVEEQCRIASLGEKALPEEARPQDLAEEEWEWPEEEWDYDPDEEAEFWDRMTGMGFDVNDNPAVDENPQDGNPTVDEQESARACVSLRSRLRIICLMCVCGCLRSCLMS